MTTTLSGVGSMPKNLVPLCVPGAVFRAQNGALVWPESRIPGAGKPGEKDYRWVIVLQNAALNRLAKPRTVLVVPCSSSGSASPFDVAISGDEPGFLRDSVAYTSLVQPILKGDLVEHLGDIRVGTLREIREKTTYVLSL